MTGPENLPSKKFGSRKLVAILGPLLLIGGVVAVLDAPGQPLRLLARPVPPEKSPIPFGPVNSVGEVVTHSRSGRVEMGAAYRFRLYTHCGVDGFIDFDGSLWDFAGPGTADDGNSNPPPGFGNPFDDGIMTLVSQDVAEYESSGGVVVLYHRRDGPKEVPICD